MVDGYTNEGMNIILNLSVSLIGMGFYNANETHETRNFYNPAKGAGFKKSWLAGRITILAI